MNNKLKYFRRFRKIRRSKPEFWFLPQDNLGYIQIPKVASRSIRIALIDHFSGQNSASFNKQKLREFSEIHSEHIKQNQIRNQHTDAFIFSFVRHPYARILSCYKNKVAMPISKKNIFACHDINLSDSFDTFVNKICEIPDRDADRHFRSQSWFLMDGDTLLTDYVGKLENIDHDWGYLSQRFNLPSIPHRNATSNTNTELSQRNKTLIQQRYQHDFSNFYSDEY
jgi:dermatan 4-sulfotransferase 1